MRILHLVTRFLAAGSERNILGLMRWELDHGHEVHLAVGRESNVDGLPAGIVVHPVPALMRPVNLRKDAAARQQVKRLLTEHDFEVLHTHQSKAGVIGREAARGRVPIVFHTVHMSAFGAGYPPIASAAFTLAERFAARYTSAIVCVGEELRQRNLDASIGRPEQYRVIRSPIDVDRFATAREVTQPEREALRRRFGVRAGAKVALAIGALEARKRQALLLGELAPLIRSGELDLLIAGDGPEREELARLSAALAPDGGVRLLGHVAEVPELLAAADLLVHASTAEGVPQVVIQALAAGVPVVATDVIGLREVPGAPVEIVPSDGAGIASTVLRAVRGTRPPPVAMEALAEWRPLAVEERLEALHREMGVLRPA